MFENKSTLDKKLEIKENKLFQKKMKKIEAIEKKYLDKNKKTTYDFFGYIMDEELEIPFFTPVVNSSYQLGKDISIKNYERVFAYTPKILRHCVTNLEKEELTNQAKNLKCFAIKCEKLAKASKYKTDEWQTVIVELVNFVSQFKQKSSSSKASASKNVVGLEK